MSQKVPSHWENPIDQFLLSNFVEPVGPLLYKFHFTPDMITTIGVIFRIFSLYSLFNNNKLNFLIGAVISYFFDCLDGHYARKYNMCTKFGDYYDHFSDIVYHSILAYYLLYISNFSKSPYSCIISIIIIGLILLMFINSGCQESFYKYNTTYYSPTCYSPTLSIFKNWCQNVEHLAITRFFGSGTVLLLIYLLIYFV